MNENAFSEFRFQTGWKKKEKICFFGKEKEIIVKLSAYFENDGITEEQKKAYIEYKNGEKMYGNGWRSCLQTIRKMQNLNLIQQRC